MFYTPEDNVKLQEVVVVKSDSAVKTELVSTKYMTAFNDSRMDSERQDWDISDNDN